MTVGILVVFVQQHSRDSRRMLHNPSVERVLVRRRLLNTVKFMISEGELALLNAAIRVVQRSAQFFVFEDFHEAVPATAAHDVVWQLQTRLHDEGCTDYPLISALNNLSEMLTSLDATAGKAARVAGCLTAVGCQDLVIHLIAIGVPPDDAVQAVTPITE
jgi:hypothetical protein